MRKIFLVTAFLFGLLNASAQVGIGLRDNQFAYIYYKFKVTILYPAIKNKPQFNNI